MTGIDLEMYERSQNAERYAEQVRAHRCRDESTPEPTYDMSRPGISWSEAVRASNARSAHSHRFAGWRLQDIQYDGWNQDNFC